MENRNQWKPRPELLLHPTIPIPLWDITPKTVLGNAWFQSERRKVFMQSGQRCDACAISKEKAEYHKWLEGHECYDINYSAGTSTFTEIVGLCHSCHNYIHQGRMRSLAKQGWFSESKLQNVLHHGRNVLALARIDPDLKKESNDSCATWWRWRLIIHGVEYKPFYRSYDELKKRYGPQNQQCA